MISQRGGGRAKERSREDEAGVDREGGVGFYNKVFEDGVWEWGVEEK